MILCFARHYSRPTIYFNEGGEMKLLNNELRENMIYPVADTVDETIQHMQRFRRVSWWVNQQVVSQIVEQIEEHRSKWVHKQVLAKIRKNEK